MSKQTLNERISLELSPVDKEEIYDEVLDEYGKINIAGITFDLSWVLKKLDPIAYGCRINDHFDACSDIYYEFDGEYYHQEEVDELKQEIMADYEDEE